MRCPALFREKARRTGSSAATCRAAIRGGTIAADVPAPDGTGPMPVLDESTAAFIASPATSIAIASRDADGWPALFKAVACRVADDRSSVTLYVDGGVARDVLRALRDGSPVAAVFSEPATHRTLQIKGERATIGPAGPGDREFAHAQFEAVVAHIAALDYPEDGVRCYFHYEPDALVAVTFAPTAAFEQTPGPGAGAKLER